MFFAAFSNLELFVGALPSTVKHKVSCFTATYCCFLRSQLEVWCDFKFSALLPSFDHVCQINPHNYFTVTTFGNGYNGYSHLSPWGADLDGSYSSPKATHLRSTGIRAKMQAKKFHRVHVLISP